MSYSKVGKWSGRDQFGCDLCGFDSLSEPKIVEHVERAHPRERAPKVKILGPSGEPIESIPVPDPELEQLLVEEAAIDAVSRVEPLGAGWFRLPDGRVICGREVAEAALTEVTPDS